MIAELIDKQDTFEVVRDQIAAILALEVASQQALATAGGKDPDNWKLRIFSERSNPWEQFRDNPTDTSPIVNVWFDSSNFDERASNVMERQKSSGTFNIDCCGYSISGDNPAGGHIPGDKGAALEAQKAVRLVRNIMMAAEYTYLGLRGLVWGRRFQSIEVFQPRNAEALVENIVCARLSFIVDFNEFSPQVPAETLELLSIDVARASDGAILAELDFDYTV